MSRSPRQHRSVPVSHAAILLALALAALAALASSAHASLGYVANNGANTVTVFETETNKAVKTITVGTSPYMVAVTPDGTRAYVTNSGSKTVTPINVASLTVGTPIAVGTDPRGIAITPDGKTAYVANGGSSTVTPIDLATNTAGAAIPVGGSPTGIAITPDGSKVFVTNFASKSVTPIVTATNTAGAAINIGKEPFGIAITPDGTRAWVANYGDNNVKAINTATNAVTTTIGTGSKPWGIAISPDGTKAYVANSNATSVTPLNLVTNTAGSAIPMQYQPTYLAFSNDGATVYVTAPPLGSLRMIDVATNTRLSDVQVGKTPSGIGITPEPIPMGAPSQATGLAASAGDKEVSLTWTAPANPGESPIDHYVVLPRSSSGNLAPVPTPTAATGFTVTGLTNGETYSFRVAAVNANGQGRASTRVSLRVPTVPTAPTGLTATAGDGEAQLGWAPPADAGGFPISHYRIVVSHDGEDQTISTPTAATNFRVTGLTRGEDYTFTVAGVNARGTGASAGPLALHLPVPPGAAENLEATTADSQVRLSWDPPAEDGGLPVLGYEITTVSGETETKTVVRGITYKILGGLANGANYEFTVTPITKLFDGTASDPLEVELPAVPERPSWPTRDPLTLVVPGGLFEGSPFNWTNGMVTLVDGVTGEAGPRIPLGPAPAPVPSQIVVSPSGGTAWVAAGTSSGVVVPVDILRHKALTPIPLGKEPWGIAISPDGSMLLVTDRASGTVTPIDTATKAAGAPIAVGSQPQSVAISPDGKTALVASFGSASVTPIDLVAMTAGAPIPVATEPWGLAISPDGTKAYVSSAASSGLVTPIDLTTLSPKAPVQAGGNGRGVAFAPDGETAYVVNSNSGTVTPIDVASDEPRAALSIGVAYGLEGIAVSPDGETAFVSEYGGVISYDLVAGIPGKRVAGANQEQRGIGLSTLDSIGLPTGPSIAVERTELAADVADPTNPPLRIRVAQYEVDPAELTVTPISSSNPAVADPSGVSVAGSGNRRLVSVTPGSEAPGRTTIVLRVSGPDGQTQDVAFEYGLTAAATTGATTRWHIGAADASTVQDVGGGYMIVANDENNPLRLYHRDASGAPIKSWDFGRLMNANEEIDFEASARVGDTIYWSASHGNSRTGNNRPTRQQVLATRISGSGVDTELQFLGYYRDLKHDLIVWDEANGDPLHLADSSGGIPKRIGGFNIEGLAFAPGSGSTAYLGFRAPLQPAVAGGKALVIPVTNFDELPQPDGVSDVHASFGEPILWNLGGLSVREIKKNASDEYLIVAGLYQAGGSYALFKWDGIPAHQPVPLKTELPATDSSGEDPGAWEGIVSVPEPIATGADVQLVMDNGSTDFFNTGQEAKSLVGGLQKARSDHFTLGAPGGVPVVIEAPKVIGSTAVGSTLTCSPGKWSGDPAPTLSYQWLRGAEEIEGATEPTYTIGEEDAGKRLRCVVTATNLFAAVPASASVALDLPAGPTCDGGGIVGQGAALQGPAHAIWASSFAESACPGGPEIAYDAVDGSGGPTEWNADGQRGWLNTDLAFVATDQAPNGAEIGNIKAAAGGAEVAVIPVAQTAIGIVVNPPAGCEIEEITNKQLESVFRGNLARWGKLDTVFGAGCAGQPITRVVRPDASGTTLQLKSYLGQVNKADLACTEAPGLGWNDLGAGGAWPVGGVGGCPESALSPLLANENPGGAGLLEMVDATEGSIGYASLPDIEASAGGETSTLRLQNNGLVKLANAIFAEPATEAASANCRETAYPVPAAGRVGSGGGENVDWSQVAGANPAARSSTYPLCALTYVLALHGYAEAGFSPESSRTARDYLHGYVLTAAGQAAIGAGPYSPLPSSDKAQLDALGAARQAAARVGW